MTSAPLPSPQACRAEKRGPDEWVCDCAEPRDDCKPSLTPQAQPAQERWRQVIPALLDEAAKIIHSLPREVFDALEVRHFLADELEGSAGLLRDAAAPQPAPSPSQEVRDAARYRWLRAGNYPIELARSILNDTPHGIDAAIDAAISAGKTIPAAKEQP